MSSIQISEPTIEPEWKVPLPPTDLIFDDGEPLEKNRHRMAMNALIHSVNHAFRDRMVKIKKLTPDNQVFCFLVTPSDIN